MSTKLVNKEGYNVELELVVTADKFEEALNTAYNKNKSKFNLEGFRKGKAPRFMIERVYGEGVFYEDAINIAFPEAYEQAVEETGIDPVDNPSIDIKEIGKGKDLVITVKVDVKPEVELGQYKGVEIEKVNSRVYKKDVEEALAAEAEKNSRLITVEDRPVEDGDTVVIDFEGFLNDEPFEGGKAENHELVIGSGNFIPGFEEQIIGKNVNDEFDVNVTFPEEYHSEDLKGKETVFKVKLHEIKVKELPELDDEFAKDISEFDTLEEYKDDLKEKMKEKRKTDSENQMKDQAITKAVENANVDVPKAMIDRRIDGLMQEFNMRLQYQGMDIEKYCQMLGTSVDDIRKQYEEVAANQVKTQLVIEAVANEEEVTASDEEVEEKIKEMAENYKMPVEDFKKNINADYIEQIKQGVVFEKAVDLIYDNAEKVKADNKDKEENNQK